MSVNQYQQTSRRASADAAQTHSACCSGRDAIPHDAAACGEQAGHLFCQYGQDRGLEALFQHLAVDYGDGHRQMSYVRFVSCSRHYYFIYGQASGNARAVFGRLRQSCHSPNAGYRKE